MDTFRIVTKIEELDKKRSKIYINHEFAFVLYKGEIRQYKLEIEQPVSENVFYEIINTLHTTLRNEKVDNTSDECLLKNDKMTSNIGVPLN